MEYMYVEYVYLYIEYMRVYVYIYIYQSELSWGVVKQVLKSTISVELLKSEAVILIVSGSEYLQVVDWNGISSLFKFLSHRHAPYDNQMGCPSHLRRWRLHAHPIQGGGAIPTVPNKVEVASSFHSRNMAESPAHLRRNVMLN